jgi:hypothetical protein
MERVLRAGAPIAPEYPLVFAGAENAAFVVDEDGGAALSACALLERNLIVRGHTIRAGLIGSVATDPLGRRQGRCARVLAAAEEELARRGALLAIPGPRRRGVLRARLAPLRLGDRPAIAPGAREPAHRPFGVRERARTARSTSSTSAPSARRAQRGEGALLPAEMEVLVVTLGAHRELFLPRARGGPRNVVHGGRGDAQALLTLLRDTARKDPRLGPVPDVPASTRSTSPSADRTGAQVTQRAWSAWALRGHDAGSLGGRAARPARGGATARRRRTGNVRFAARGEEPSCAGTSRLLFAPRGSCARRSADAWACRRRATDALPLGPRLDLAHARRWCRERRRSTASI